MSMAVRSFTIPRAALASMLALLLAFGFIGFRASGAFALGPGEECMFNAPSGAQLPLGKHAGHVGWGFQVGGTSTWLFGATEGTGAFRIPPGPPVTTQTWGASGSFSVMLAAFRNAGHFHAANYYTRYRCISTATSAVGAAAQTATQLAQNGYDGLTNNCLTKAVAIFKTYRGNNLLSGAFTPPTLYFNALNLAGWGPIHNL